MKILKKNIPLLLIYITGINCYFCFWFLGSETAALSWSHSALTFFHIWKVANISSVIVFSGLVYFRWFTNRSALFHFQSNRSSTLVQWIFGTLLFSLMVIFGLSTQVEWIVVESYSGTFGYLSLSFYHFSLFLIIIIFSNLNDRLGNFRMVTTYLFKTFSAPRQLEKGFMFLDLNSSTQIAEQLQSKNYSLFLRHCFKLLDQLVEKCEGIEIYQYAGDEAILHWDYHNHTNCLEAIRLFKGFKELLEEQKEHFIGKYNVIPIFKAAIHGGSVVQSQLGQNVIHTAFHGDVLNTTSRILGLCHKHQTDLLLSKEYFTNLNDEHLKNYYLRIDDEVVNGKKHKLTVYKPIQVLT